jgi:ABC-2 type transport system ATP-binding protein
VGNAVEAEGLVKRFGDVTALHGVDIAVPEGSVLGLLGPNGAGKTTCVRILTTLIPADSGRAVVAGYDVFREPQAVRAIIGLAGQYAAVDEDLTGRENIDLVGRLYHLPTAQVRKKATELLERFELAQAADRPVKTYSGGMRRRLDLCASLVADPVVLFLDEPTTGLDPRSRLGLWDVIASLKAQGTTIVLTTQYLEEADRLADRITVVDLGRVIAEGTADELKGTVGGEVLDLVVADRAQTAAAATELGGLANGELTTDAGTGRVTVPVSQGATQVAEAVRRLDAAGIAIADLSLHRPTLDDVFLALTGHGTGDEGEPESARGRAGRRRRRGRRATPVEEAV